MAAQREPKPVFDRVPPQNIEAERSVLGAMLLNPDAVGAALEVLHENAAEVFYVEAHQQIYNAMIELFRKNTPVDEITLLQQLMTEGHLETAGGASYIAELLGAVPTSANINYYAKIVLDAAIRRKLISHCTQIAGTAYEGEGEVEELLDRAESSIFSVAQTRQTNPIYHVRTLVSTAVENIEKLYKSHAGITGLPTGFSELDKILAGLQPSDMVVLAARPSVGKTALALNFAQHAALHENKGVLMFSLEMAREQLTQRLLCMVGSIDSKKLREGFLSGQELRKLPAAADRLYQAPIFIDDTPNISMLEMRSKARRHMAQHDVSLVIIDYLQLMGGSRRAENRQVEISDISRSIKTLARELRVPIVALSQLSREAEKDDTGIPKLSHLRESGSIEQDADVVLMLWRPPAHKRGGDEDAPFDDPQIKLSIAKHRNGPTGVIDLLFFKNTQQFQTVAKGGERSGVTIDEAPPEDDDTPF